MRRLPHECTLFPYTTLFRSIDIDREIASAKAMLIALGSSHFLQTQDYERFHQQSLEVAKQLGAQIVLRDAVSGRQIVRSEEHTSELQSHSDLVCRLLLEKKK